MKLKAITILFILSAILTGCGAERNINKGKKMLGLGEYYDAGEQFKKAYSKTSSTDHEKRGEISRLMAQCYAKINYTGRAVAAYRNMERYKQAKAEDLLEMGKQQMKIGDYKNAALTFKVALDSLPGNEQAKNGLEAAMKAPQMKQDGSTYKVKAATLFNSRRDDYSPMLTGDEYNKIYFTSTRNEAQGDELSAITGTKAADIFVCEKDDKDKWGKPEAVSGGLNTEYEEGACAFSPDGQTMYLTQCSTDPSYPRYAKIMTSSRSDAAWGKGSDINISRDTLSSYAHPAISPDGEWLYFTSDMPGGMGGLDIWRIRLTKAGLGGVENLGAPINTAGNEEFPTFRPNGDLYFSSDGHPGLGGLDIFIAKVNKKGKYELSHPGYPLNSNADDFGMTFEGAHDRGFFSSNRNDARGYDHIYSFENSEIEQTVKGWVYEMEAYELPSAQVYVIGNDGTNEKLSVKGDGSFTKVLKPKVSYLFLASCKGYLNHKEELTTDSMTKMSKEYTLQFPLASITAPVLIDNIFYDFDKATLSPESTKSLNELVDLLKENSNVTIELSAHCDYKGSEVYNKWLSQVRAETVVKYLISKGIATDRLTPMGYGKEKPKTIRKKLTEKYPWLKENDVLSEEFIKKLKPEQQEICNQLNRRTEFIVLRTTYGMFDNKGQLKQQSKEKTTEKKNIDDNSFDIDIE